MFPLKLVIELKWYFVGVVSQENCYPNTLTFFSVSLFCNMTNEYYFQSDITNKKVKWNIFVFYCIADLGMVYLWYW